MASTQLSSLYQQLILDHYRNPRNKSELEEKTVEIHMANPVCGDEIRLQLRIEDDHIVEAKFVGQGCSISQAAVSMMTTLLKASTSGGNRPANTYRAADPDKPEGKCRIGRTKRRE